MDELLRDRLFGSAVSNVKPRSDRQQDLTVLQRTYVETGVLPQLNNTNHQILYGRRGTGKSHVLRILDLEVKNRERSTTVYVDVRLLGSAQLMTDDTRPLVVRCVSVFKDFLSAVQSELLDIATDPRRDGSGMEEVSQLADAIAARTSTVAHREFEYIDRTSTGETSGIGATVSLEPALTARIDQAESESHDRTVRFTETFRETVVFAEVGSAIARAIRALGVERLYLLVDEWTSIPTDIQPYVAEFIKRTLLPITEVTVKIASLEYRSNFTIPTHQGNPVGFELGSDIAANLDLDDYYVYDRNPEQVVDIFLELLYKHVESELPPHYLASAGITNPTRLRSRLFTEPATFVELVRAGEGVVRDFLGIFSAAFFKAQRGGRQKLDLNSVEGAARDWFETDKSTTLSTELLAALNRIMTEVIGTRQSTMFMLVREQADHSIIQALFDLRLIHLVSRGYSDKENPGLRYNIYSLDYGTYVNLKRTKSMPALLSETPGEAEEEATADRIVPFADKRSIRRVILDTRILAA